MPDFRLPLKTDQGFTLIELLVALLMTVFVGAAVYVSLAQGIRVWQKAVGENTQSRQEFFFEELKSDLRNMSMSVDQSFRGNAREAKFYTRLRDTRKDFPATRKTGLIPARVRYYFNPAQKRLQKEIVFYEKLLRGSDSGPEETKVLLDSAEGFELSYYRHPEDGRSASWVKEWSGKVCPPAAVKVRLLAAQGVAHPGTRVFSIPLAAGCQEEQES